MHSLSYNFHLLKQNVTDRSIGHLGQNKFAIIQFWGAFSKNNRKHNQIIETTGSIGLFDLLKLGLNSP